MLLKKSVKVIAFTTVILLYCPKLGGQNISGEVWAKVRRFGVLIGQFV